MTELFDGSRPVQFEYDPVLCEDGTLMVLLSSSLGSGSFKDAHHGFMTLTPSSLDGLGSRNNQDVAVKQMIQGRDDQGSARRFDVATEHRHTICKGNLLLWAMSLFDLSLSFVDYILKKTRPLPSSLIIPKICFVEGGIALVHDSTVGKNIHAASSHGQTLVIEELIESPFVKFVHNRAPVPYLAADHPLFYMADILCFTQHVQYEKSGGLVFISDYQGSKLLLSDPQIMTSP
ncbi:unnamed protein product [Mycena citricolor]|uniref:Alpha-type protein kinase domain-containing protein n=1 Tax=Mycena citricolor TaxID=2018698 RepID=A0AAD2HS39_9AGAR|nr:unnamed protein product [Mycena citricolor]